MNPSSGSVFKTEILTINASTGGVMNSVPRHYIALVVDQSTGTLYRFDASNNLVRVNPSSGATDVVADLPTTADGTVRMGFGLAADGASHTIFGVLGTYDGNTGDVSDQLISIRDETGAINVGVSSSDPIMALAFAGPAVPITPDTLKADVQSALASGEITKAGVAKTLLDDLNAAQAARDRGQCKTAANVYQPFISDVNAQTGKSIAAATASKLVSEAQFLMVNCP